MLGEGNIHYANALVHCVVSREPPDLGRVSQTVVPRMYVDLV
jgi:hypothetical protein